MLKFQIIICSCSVPGPSSSLFSSFRVLSRFADTIPDGPADSATPFQTYDALWHAHSCLYGKVTLPWDDLWCAHFSLSGTVTASSNDLWYFRFYGKVTAPGMNSDALILTSTAMSRPPWTTSGASNSSAPTSVFQDLPTPYPMAPPTLPHRSRSSRNNCSRTTSGTPAPTARSQSPEMTSGALLPALNNTGSSYTLDNGNTTRQLAHWMSVSLAPRKKMSHACCRMCRSLESGLA